MIAAIIIGREGSKGFPGKNMAIVNDRSLLEYPLIAAVYSAKIGVVRFSSDSDKYLDYARTKFSVGQIKRPPELATDEALAEDVFIHAANQINADMYVLMFANAPCINSQMIDNMIQELQDSDDHDSICTLSEYQMFSPYRARKVDGEYFGVQSYLNLDYSKITCDRNSYQKCYYYDCSCAVVRNYCLTKEYMQYAQPPQKWLGVNILPYYQEIPALDVDYEWQLGQVKYWLDRNGKK